MSVDTLRRAATILREHVAGVQPLPGRWEPAPDHVNGSWVWNPKVNHPVADSLAGPGVAVYVALLDPPVAQALADWLEGNAEALEGWGTQEIPPTSLIGRALATARALLREEAPDER